jgi:NapC/NirT cytochrome c family, N-terminal region
MSEQDPEKLHPEHEERTNGGGEDGGDEEQQQPPRLIYNRLSMVGAAVAILTLANMLFLLFIAILGVQENPYVGIFAYLVLPVIMLMGLLLVPVGMLFERRRRRRALPRAIPLFPRIDLNLATTRHAFLGAIVFALFFLVLSAAGSYQAYHFTDSVTFCGETCHAPMKPEFTAYQDSPHARVPCVSCHVGPGATWYVRSKLSGVYQVYAVASDTYPRPIATPIKDLRPVREACEQCHWPKKFYGAQLKVFTHFAYDEKNTPTQIQMLIDTGGGSAEFGRAAGIHWHMNIANRVWFVATDKQHQVIPWVKVISEDGRVTEYVAKGSSMTPKQIAAAPKHLMDCVTCHTRPSHKFRPPDEAVDQAMVAGRLDESLPFVKKEAVGVLTQTYPSSEVAMQGIATGLAGFYQNKYPNLYAEKNLQIKEAIHTVQSIYRNNIFPYMKVDWRTHPDNIGHLYYPGCFRCHDGQHVTADGRVIPNGCDTCHTMLAQKPADGQISTTPGKPFKHPIDLASLKGVTCSNCHTGAAL